MKRILAVDDEDAILRCFERALKPRGYNIQTTNDPVKTLELVSKEDFDLVMLDVLMPKATGFDIYQQIRKRSRPAAVLFVTAFPGSFNAESELMVRMWTKEFADGRTDILYKPFEIATLLEKVESLIGSGADKGDT